jgi:transposase-like protein
MSTVTVLSGPERRRRWSGQKKARIVEESLRPGAAVTEVARRHDVHPNLLHYWRRQVRQAAGRKVSFLPVAISTEKKRAAAGGSIEIELGDGVRVRIDALFAIERDSNGSSPTERRRVRQERSKPLVETLASWLREQHAKVSPNGKTGKAIAYSLNAWEALCRFLDDGRLCMSNNAAERAMRPLATGRRNWTAAAINTAASGSVSGMNASLPPFCCATA